MTSSDLLCALTVKRFDNRLKPSARVSTRIGFATVVQRGPGIFYTNRCVVVNGKKAGLDRPSEPCHYAVQDECTGIAG